MDSSTATRSASLATLLMCVLLAGWTTACSSTTTTAPTPPPTANTTLNGVWSGDLSLQGITARMTWTLTQAGSAVTGPVLVVLPTGTVLLNGALTGTVSGSTLNYTINIGSGAIPSQPNCVGQLGGAATSNFTTSGSTLSGSYAINNSTCSTPFTTGSFTLIRP